MIHHRLSQQEQLVHRKTWQLDYQQTINEYEYEQQKQNNPNINLNETIHIIVDYLLHNNYIHLDIMFLF